MKYYAAFHLGIYCLQKYSFVWVSPNTKGLKKIQVDIPSYFVLGKDICQYYILEFETFLVILTMIYLTTIFVILPSVIGAMK